LDVTQFSVRERVIFVPQININYIKGSADCTILT